MTDNMTPSDLSTAIAAETAASAERIAIAFDNAEDPMLRKYLQWQRSVRDGDIARLGLEAEVFGAGWHAAIAHRGAADPRLEDVEVVEGWLVETTEGCTCGTGGLPGHIPGCGSIAIAPLDEVLEAHAIVNGADTVRTVQKLHSAVVHHPGRDGGPGSRSYLPASTIADAWARGDAESRRSPGAVVERVEVTTVTTYQTIARTEVTR